MSRSIRVATPNDAAALCGIYAPIVASTVISFELVVPTVDDMQQRIATTTRTHPWLICEQDSHIHGYAYASTHRVRAAYRWAADVSVYVANDARGSGVGRTLYTKLFDILRLQSFRTALAGITLPNAASVALHESMGFEPVGVYRNIGYKQGAWHDVGWWAKSLAACDGEPAEPMAFSALDATELQLLLRSS